MSEQFTNKPKQEISLNVIKTPISLLCHRKWDNWIVWKQELQDNCGYRNQYTGRENNNCTLSINDVM